MATTGYLIFRVGGAGGAMALDRVREILPAAALVRPPGMDQNLAGFLDLGGKLVPVLRLDRMIHLPAGEMVPESHLILLRDGAHPSALLVDRALGVTQVDAKDVREARGPGGAPIPHVRYHDELHFVLDPDRLLARFGISALVRTDGSRAGDAA